MVNTKIEFHIFHIHIFHIHIFRTPKCVWQSRILVYSASYKKVKCVNVFSQMSYDWVIIVVKYVKCHLFLSCVVGILQALYFKTYWCICNFMLQSLVNK